MDPGRRGLHRADDVGVRGAPQRGVDTALHAYLGGP